MSRRRPIARCAEAAAVLSFMLAGTLTGCSLMDLGDFGLDGCERPEQCDVLNERDGLDEGDCMIWQCRADKRGCEQRPRDLDGDRHPDADACSMLDVPLDCADRDERRAEGLVESADRRDNDCDTLIDEDAPQQPVRRPLDSLPAPAFASYGQGDGAALYLLAGAQSTSARGWVLSDETSTAHDFVYGYAGGSGPGCQTPADGAGEAGRCRFVELALSAVADELITAGVNDQGCAPGQLRVGVGRAGEFAFRASPERGRSNVEWGVDLDPSPAQGADPCTIAGEQEGARSPRIAALPASSGLESGHVLVLWLAAHASMPCEREADVLALGLWPQGRRNARWLQGGRGGHGEVIGRSAGCVPPSVAALGGETASGYAVAIAGNAAIELLWIAQPDALDTSLAKSALRGSLAADAPAHVALAVVPEAAAGTRGWLLAWRSAAQTGELGFAPFAARDGGLVASEPQRLQRPGEITAGPVAAYALSGFALPALDASTSTGGWLIAWSERGGSGSRLMGLRVADLPDQNGGTRVLGEPFELGEGEARFPFVCAAQDAGFDYGFVAVHGQSGELTLGRLE